MTRNEVQLKALEILKQNIESDGKQQIDEMLKNIPNIFDVKLLKKIIKEDGRDKVIKAAQEQYDLIKNPSKNKEVKENEHFA